MNIYVKKLQYYFFPTVNIKYNAATPNMQALPNTGATLWHNEITIIGGLKRGKIKKEKKI
jgi:hypothetical protein